MVLLEKKWYFKRKDNGLSVGHCNDEEEVKTRGKRWGRTPGECALRRGDSRERGGGEGDPRWSGGLRNGAGRAVPVEGGPRVNTGSFQGNETVIPTGRPAPWSRPPHPVGAHQLSLSSGGPVTIATADRWQGSARGQHPGPGHHTLSEFSGYHKLFGGIRDGAVLPTGGQRSRGLTRLRY